MPIRRRDYRERNMKYVILILQESTNNFIRPVEYYDIHWRNSELLCKYLSETAKIKNKYLSLLPDH